MASVNDVLDALAEAVGVAIANAGVQSQGFVAPGWPLIGDLTKQMEQLPAQYYVSIYPMATERLTTRFFPTVWNIATTTPQLTGSVTGSDIVFSGTPTSGINVNAILNGGTLGSIAANFQPTANMALSGVAVGVATAIDALGMAGVTASASGSTVSVSGVSSLACNIGGMAQTVFEAMRTERNFLVAVWAPDAATRSAVAESIKNGFSTVYFLQFPDTSWGRLKYISSPWSDDMQLDTLYWAKMLYSVEWGTMASGAATQIAAAQVSMTTVSASISGVVDITEG